MSCVTVILGNKNVFPNSVSINTEQIQATCVEVSERESVCNLYILITIINTQNTNTIPVCVCCHASWREDKPSPSIMSYRDEITFRGQVFTKWQTSCPGLSAPGRRDRENMLVSVKCEWSVSLGGEPDSSVLH
jgi:hypothetical protein